MLQWAERVGLDRWLLVAALAIGIAGVPHAEQPADGPRAAVPGLTVTVAAVGDRGDLLATVAAQRGEWAASRGAEVVIRPDPVDPRVAPGGRRPRLSPATRLGDLVDAGALAVLPESLVLPPAPKESDEDAAEPANPVPADTGADADPDPLRFADIVPAFRDQVAKYGSDRMAFPYGGSALVLVYDRAAFEREANRAAADERIARRCGRPGPGSSSTRWPGSSRAATGTATARPITASRWRWGPTAEGLGDAIFLARAASLGQHRDQYSFLFDADTMAPRIDSPPFVEALEAPAALKASGPPEMAGFDAEAARRAFREGKVAMLIDRAEMAARWSHGKTSIGVAPLPGSERVYDPVRKAGRTARPAERPELPALRRRLARRGHRAAAGKQRDAAIDFARYLISPETARRVRADRAFPMLPVRSALLGQGPPDPRAALGVDVAAMVRRGQPDPDRPAGRPGPADSRRPTATSPTWPGGASPPSGASTAASLPSRQVAEAWTRRTEELGARGRPGTTAAA